MKTLMIMLTSLLLLTAALLGPTNVQGLLVPSGSIGSGAITELNGTALDPLPLILLGSGLIGCSFITRIKSKKRIRTQ